MATKLMEIAEEEVEAIASGREFLGVAIGGSLGRGESWPGSDVDIYVVESGAIEAPRKRMRIRHGVIVDQTVLSREDLEELSKPANLRSKYTDSSLPDELHQCRILQDPEGLLKRFKEYNEANLLNPVVVSLKRSKLIREAANLLDQAQRTSGPRRRTILMRDCVQELAKARMVEAEGMRKGLKTIPDRMRKTLDNEFCRLHGEIWRTGMARRRAEDFLAEYKDLMFRQHVAFLKGLWPRTTEDWRGKKGWETLDDLEPSIEKSREYNDLVYGRTIESGRFDSGVVLIRSFLNYFPDWSLARTYHESQGLKPPEATDIDRMEEWAYLPEEMLETYLRLQEFDIAQDGLMPQLRGELVDRP